VTTAVRPRADEAVRALIRQPHGKLVAAGYSDTDTDSRFALVRYNSDGSLDTTFGRNGRVTAPNGDADAVVRQPDGKLVAAGTDDNFVVARYTPEGALDATFGVEGVVTTTFAEGLSFAAALVRRPDGKLVVAGGTNSNSTDRQLVRAFALARYNADGTLDQTFGDEGKVTTVVGPIASEARALVLQPDGKIVAAGRSDRPGTEDVGGVAPVDFALARYNPDGSLDTTFGTGGMATTAVGPIDSAAFALLLQPDGKLVAGGYSFPRGGGPSGDNYRFALVRYNADGTLDQSFGRGGIVVTAVDDGIDIVHALRRQPNGKIVAAGNASGAYFTFALARYTPDGVLDASFGHDGTVTTAFRGMHGGASALVGRPDGRLVAAGDVSAHALSGRFALVRYIGK
jgi:uncharacterized delta-60 repeat protein